jgi:protease-4
MKSKNLLLLAVIAIGALILLVVPAALLIASSLPQPACVGVIHVDGELVTQDSPGGLFSSSSTSSDTFTDLMDEAAKRDEIKSVLFEINSPGGSVVASSEMYQTSKELNKPKVMFFREMGASGAYYLASSGNYVISNPDALTGSIGVRTTISDMSGLFGKLGINATNVKSGELKDMGDSSRPPTDKELAIMQAMVDEIFNEFKQVVLDARTGKPRFTQAGFETILDGRVLTGRQAYALGLVDALGGKKDALKKAAELGGITDENPRTCELSHTSSFLDRLFASASFSLSNAISRAFAISAGNGVGVSFR